MLVVQVGRSLGVARFVFVSGPFVPDRPQFLWTANPIRSDPAVLQTLRQETALP